METQNITLALPKSALRQIKRLAAQRQISVSSMLTLTLMEMVRQEEQYNRAQRRHLQWLAHGADLGTGGNLKTKWEQLHERR